MVRDKPVPAPSRTHTPATARLKAVRDGDHRLDERGVVDADGFLFVTVERKTYQSPHFCDGDAARPVTTNVVASLGRGPCFRAPFRSSTSSTCLPTSRFQERHSPPRGRRSHRSRQRCRQRRQPYVSEPRCRQGSATDRAGGQGSGASRQAMSSCTTWRLISALWVRRWAVAFLPRKPVTPINCALSHCPHYGAHSNRGAPFHADCHLPTAAPTEKVVFTTHSAYQRIKFLIAAKNADWSRTSDIRKSKSVFLL
jgi:hypothetical protein